MNPFDIFGFISGLIILIFVVAVIIFVIVILIIYKLLHTNVDDVNTKKKSLKTETTDTTNIYRASNEEVKVGAITTKDISICKYCGEKIDENAPYCPFCGSNLSS